MSSIDFFARTMQQRKNHTIEEKQIEVYILFFFNFWYFETNFIYLYIYKKRNEKNKLVIRFATLHTIMFVLNFNWFYFNELCCLGCACATSFTHRNKSTSMWKKAQWSIIRSRAQEAEGRGQGSGPLQSHRSCILG
jgi:hypothetical protein